MKRLLISMAILALMILPVYATAWDAPGLPIEVDTYMEDDPATFWNDLWSVLREALVDVRPDLAEATKTCICLIGIILLGTIVIQYADETKQTVCIVITVSTGLLMMRSTNSLIELGKETVNSMTEYGKLILPVLTGALAAQGGTATSAALYSGTALFSATLSAAISKVLIPLLYIYLCLCVACSAVTEEMLKQLRDFIKWVLTWGLKLVLYLFTGYMSITGVISGTVDASALKATKLAISGAVPVVGNILSDASETILLSAGVMKNSVGAYGLVALASLLIGPFIKIGVHYLLLKVTAAVCSVFAQKQTTNLLFGYCSAMGFVLAMTGISCLLLMVGIVCFMKGIG